MQSTSLLLQFIITYHTLLYLILSYLILSYLILSCYTLSDLTLPIWPILPLPTYHCAFFFFTMLYYNFFSFLHFSEIFTLVCYRAFTRTNLTQLYYYLCLPSLYVTESDLNFTSHYLTWLYLASRYLTFLLRYFSFTLPYVPHHTSASLTYLPHIIRN